MKKLILALTMAAGFALPSKAAFPMPGFRYTFGDLDGTRHTKCFGNSTDCGTIHSVVHGSATFLVVTYNNGNPNDIYESVYCRSVDIEQNSDGSTTYTYKPVE